MTNPRARTILPYNRQSVLRIELQEHRGLRHVDIRLWVGSVKDPEKLTATQKGVKLYPENGRAVLAAISKALDVLETDVE